MKVMKNGILALLLMSSAASAKVTITPHKDRTKAELAAEYSKFRILAEASSLDNADGKAEWKLRQVQFFKSGKCTGQPIRAEPSKFTSSDDNVKVGSLFDRDPSDVVIIGPNGADNYWVGHSAANAKSLGCVKVKQTANNRMRGFKVQVGDGEGNYKTLYTVSDIDGGGGTFKLLKAKDKNSAKGTGSKGAKGSGPKTIEGFCTVPTVTADVYEVTGSGDPTPGSEVNEAFALALIDCGDLDYGSDFADCLETNQANGVLFNYPLFPRNNDGTAAESQFVTSATDAGGAGGPPTGSLNDSYFKGDVNGAASLAKNKVDIQWIDYSLEGLFNVPIADIEYIQYDFYPKNCGDMDDPTCIKQFYLNVYTHRAIALAGDWYDCKYDFVPNDVDFKVGEWNTFKITSDTLSSRTQAKATGTKVPEPFTQGGACPNGEGGLTDQGVDLYNAVKLADGAATLPDSPDQFLLGAADAPNLQPLIFAFNMGDTLIGDEGLVGYFDNIRVQIKDQPLIIMDL